MTEETPPIAGITEEALDALLKRAIRNTILLGLVPALALWIASGWRNAGMLVVGAGISAASILEWRKLARLINDRMKKKKSQRSAILVIAFFLLRLVFFGAAIYGSLKCLQGSPIALLFGLSLAVMTLMWEAIRMLRE
jgi:hypothetical protein